jgi:hypothetical protein
MLGQYQADRARLPDRSDVACCQRRQDTDAAGVAPLVSRFQRHVTEGQNLRAVQA